MKTLPHPSLLKVTVGTDLRLDKDDILSLTKMSSLPNLKSVPTLTFNKLGDTGFLLEKLFSVSPHPALCKCTVY